MDTQNTLKLLDDMIAEIIHDLSEYHVGSDWWKIASGNDADKANPEAILDYMASEDLTGYDDAIWIDGMLHGLERAKRMIEQEATK